MESGNPHREPHASKLLQRSVAITPRGGTFVICIALTLICVSWARAQDGPDESSGARSEYGRGYDEGYKAGLRAAAAAKSGGQSATVAAGAKPKAVDGGGQNPPNGPAAIAASSTTAPASNAPANQDLVPKVKSIWEELTTPGDKDQDTVFHHSNTSPYWLSAQSNFVAQMHPRFHADYSGPNSFGHAEEQAVSKVITLFTGFQLNDSTEMVLDAESSGWSGLSQALGFGAMVNLDAVRNPSLSAEPYLARLWLRKVIALSDDTVEIERSPLGLLTTLPARRIDIHFGKMTLPDFFDINSVGGDSHMQFLNWAVDNNPAWDYAADTRGYTYAAVFEYEDRNWAARFGEALEPTQANGDTLEWNPRHAHSENFEVEYHPQLILNRFGAIRFLYYMNYANMGNYHQAIANFERLKALGKNIKVPNIDEHYQVVSLKYGFGLNMEQELTDTLRVYSRAGWNEGQHESWAYTECDAHVSFGGICAATGGDGRMTSTASRL